MTKIHEEFIRGSVEKVLKKLAEQPAQGEFVLLISAPNLPETHNDIHES
jgi:16S rRNA C1402 (ribose-2'-O) methylase RsmI